MEPIDDDGNLFGVVNVVDALVVLLVLAMVVAGVALINPFGSSGEEATRYATIDMGDQQPYIAEQIEEGDLMSPQGTSKNLTVTDVYVTPGSGENVSVTVRVEAKGQLVPSDQRDGSVFQFSGQTIRQGNPFTITTDEYEVSGPVTNLTESGPNLERASTAVVVQANLPASAAESISAGDAHEVADSTVAEITDVHVGPGADPNSRRVSLAMELSTLGTDDPTFAERRVAVGSSVSFRGDAYALTGEIIQVGNATVETTTSQVTLQTTLDANTADSISAGDAYRLGDERIGTITDVRVFPGPNPDQRTVILGAELTTITRTDGQYFGGTRIATGQTISFRGDDYSFGARIQDSGSSSVESTDTEVVIETTMSAAVADAMDVGDEYRVAGETVGTIQSLEVYPTANEDTKRVLVGVRLRTLQRNGNRYFGTRQVQIGTTIPFEGDGYTVSGTVINQGSLSPPGDVVTRTVTVKLANVPPEFADGLTEGLIERQRGTTTARVTDRRAEPAVITLTSESGDIFRREHPVNKDVYLTVEVTARETASGLRFHGQSLREGSTVTLDFRSITAQGTVIDIGNETND